MKFKGTAQFYTERNAQEKPFLNSYIRSNLTYGNMTFKLETEML